MPRRRCGPTGSRGRHTLNSNKRLTATLLLTTSARNPLVLPVPDTRSRRTWAHPKKGPLPRLSQCFYCLRRFGFGPSTPWWLQGAGGLGINAGRVARDMGPRRHRVESPRAAPRAWPRRFGGDPHHSTPPRSPPRQAGEAVKALTTLRADGSPTSCLRRRGLIPEGLRDACGAPAGVPGGGSISPGKHLLRSPRPAAGCGANSRLVATSNFTARGPPRAVALVHEPQVKRFPFDRVISQRVIPSTASRKALRRKADWPHPGPATPPASPAPPRFPIVGAGKTAKAGRMGGGAPAAPVQWGIEQGRWAPRPFLPAALHAVSAGCRGPSSRTSPKPGAVGIWKRPVLDRGAIEPEGPAQGGVALLDRPTTPHRFAVAATAGQEAWPRICGSSWCAIFTAAASQTRTALPAQLGDPARLGEHRVSPFRPPPARRGVAAPPRGS